MHSLLPCSGLERSCPCVEFCSEPRSPTPGWTQGKAALELCVLRDLSKDWDLLARWPEPDSFQMSVGQGVSKQLEHPDVSHPRTPLPAPAEFLRSRQIRLSLKRVLRLVRAAPPLV